MKKLFVISFLVAQFSIFAQTINETWVKENYTKKEYTITMRDGVKLFTTVYAPKNNCVSIGGGKSYLFLCPIWRR